MGADGMKRSARLHICAHLRSSAENSGIRMSLCSLCLCGASFLCFCLVLVLSARKGLLPHFERILGDGGLHAVSETLVAFHKSRQIALALGVEAQQIVQD